MKNLKALAEELKSIYNEVDEQRAYWDNELKPLIIKTFKYVKNNIDLKLKVRLIDEVKNLEAVRLTFGFLNSGLFVEPKKNKGNIPPMVLVKKGGYLAYSQMANGKISVFVHFPFIEGIYGDPERIHEIGTFTAGEINREKIMDHIEIFLDQIVRWEKEEKNLIGFHISGKK